MLDPRPVRRAVHACVAAGTAIALAGCPYRAPTPKFGLEDARAGRFVGPPPSKAALCKHWLSATSRDEWAMVHTSFPDTSPEASCFTPVTTHADHSVTFPPAPRGCAFPSAPIPVIDPGAPNLLPCDVRDRARVVAHNAHVLERLRERHAGSPYAAVVLAGEGREAQAELLRGYVPDDACASLPEVPALGAMPARAAHAAAALRVGVAPIAIVTGGSPHSRLVEAFALFHLLTCKERIEPDRILLEPCAEHTHTNLRNAARWLDAIGARAAYLVTDDSLQADYFQDASMFDFIFGTIDQRSLRDWGWLIGSWHQASVGRKSGFWFTPYRFWAEPQEGLGRVTCVND